MILRVMIIIVMIFVLIIIMINTITIRFLYNLKPQDSFGRFVFKKFSIFRKWTIPSESTSKPTGNCIE